MRQNLIGISSSGNLTNSILYLLPFVVVLLFPEPACANIGVPMIAVTLPWMVLALVPVILIEGFILARRHTLPFSLAASVMSKANILSTFIGIPVTWLVLMLLQMLTGGGTSHGIKTVAERFLAVTWQAPWLIPYESELYWMIPAAFLVLSLPFFISSYYLESFIVGKKLNDLPLPSLKQSVLFANLASYALLDASVIFISILKPLE
jgi:hypothetical protein